jgi:hypothetical protein
MYVEENGYVIMNKEDMRFYGKDTDFVDEIDEAMVYTDKSAALEDLYGFNEEYPDCYELVNFHKTIWLDKMGIENVKTTTCHHCGMCEHKEEDDIDE